MVSLALPFSLLSRMTAGSLTCSISVFLVLADFKDSLFLGCLPDVEDLEAFFGGILFFLILPDGGGALRVSFLDDFGVMP